MASPKKSVCVISSKDDRAAEITDALTGAGFAAKAGTLDSASLRALRATDVAAIIIDLARMPAQGRDIGIFFRTRASTRAIPLIFVDGAEEKVAGTRDILPDAFYTNSAEMPTTVTDAIANPPSEPVVPSSNFAGYSGTPLPKKLGIKPNSVVAMADAPEEFEAVLGDLPAGVTVRRTTGKDAAVTLWFVRSVADLVDGIVEMAAVAGDGRLWVCWPKKASGVVTDVTQNEVRSRGLATGIVDFKICAIDDTWSGLCFTNRR